MNDPQIEQSLLVVFIAIGLLVAWVVLAYLKLMRKYYLIQVDYRAVRSKIKRKAQKLEEHARDKSHHIVEHAQDRAEEIIHIAQSIGEHESETIDSEITASAAQLSAEFKRVASVEIEAFRKAMQSSTLDAQSAARAKIEEAEKRVSRELAAYKLEREKEIERDILMIVKDTVTKVTGKVISLDDHKELVLKALREARRKRG